MTVLSRRSFLLSASVAIRSPQPRVPSPDRIDAVVRETIKRGHTPGMALGLLQQGIVSWTRGYGFANVERQVPMTPDSVLNIGSVSKTITATAIMQLWEKGQLDLDAAIDQMLPFPVRNPAFTSIPITARQLLTHTSSVRDNADYDASYACGDPTVSLATWVEKYFRSGNPRKPFTVTRPGTTWHYTNVGFGLLGVIVEAVSKQTYADYTMDRVFLPLNMSSTSWYLSRMDLARHAIPYDYVAHGRAQVEVLQEPRWSPGQNKAPTYVPHCLYSFPTLPDGLVRTSVNDLCRFLAAYQLGGALDGQRILRTETVRAMLTGHSARRLPKGLGQGLAWYRSGTIWGHNGGDPGIHTEMAMRSDGLGVVVISNALDRSAGDIAHYLLTARPGPGQATTGPCR